MSNKNNNIAKQQRLTEKQRLKKKKMLLQIQKEINKLENEIKHSKISNAKIYALRGLKMALRTGQLIAPYAVTAGITFGGFAAFGGTPFYRDEHKQKLEMMKELDSFGNIRYEQQYDVYENSQSTISHYGKWKLFEDNLYSRDIEVYSIEDITEETIIKLINENNTSSLQEVLGEPISRKTETKNNLSEEELQSESFLQAVMFFKFDDDFIMVQESSIENILLTIFWVAATIPFELMPTIWREHCSFDYDYCIAEIKRKHPAIDIDALTKKLEIKRSNYDRLTR